MAEKKAKDLGLFSHSEDHFHCTVYFSKQKLENKKERRKEREKEKNNNDENEDEDEDDKNGIPWWIVDTVTESDRTRLLFFECF